MWGVSIRPEHTVEVAVPLISKLGRVLPQHCLQRAIEPLNQAVALGVIGRRVELANP